jgi:hypothetical protein
MKRIKQKNSPISSSALTLILIASMPATAVAGIYAPIAGELGSEAIHMDDPSIVAWATSVESLTRGPQNIADETSALASYGTTENALGAALGSSSDVVSLGDGGSITLGFDNAIYDGDGFDFVVFENSFSDSFLEFAFVEVSSNGIDFFRFEADYAPDSDTPTQISAFGSADTTEYDNLAGKYKQGYGTPFDLSELDGISGLDINNIQAIRLVDVVGSLDPLYGSTDKDGDLINDPYSTPFSSSGFDLDAIGVINAVPEPRAYAAILGLLALSTTICNRRARR